MRPSHLPATGLPPSFKHKTTIFYDGSCNICHEPLLKGSEAFFCVSPYRSQYLCPTCADKRDYSFEVTPDMYWSLACRLSSCQQAQKMLQQDLNKAISWLKELTKIKDYYQIYEELQGWYEFDSEYYVDEEEET